MRPTSLVTGIWLCTPTCKILYETYMYKTSQEKSGWPTKIKHVLCSVHYIKIITTFWKSKHPEASWLRNSKMALQLEHYTQFTCVFGQNMQNIVLINNLRNTCPIKISPFLSSQTFASRCYYFQKVIIILRSHKYLLNFGLECCPPPLNHFTAGHVVLGST